MNLIEEYAYEERIIFRFKYDQTDLSFDRVVKGIKDSIKPESIAEEEITSWYQASSFTKNDLEVVFTDIYIESPPVYEFELFPRGSHSTNEITQLRNWVQALAQYLFNIA